MPGLIHLIGFVYFRLTTIKALSYSGALFSARLEQGEAAARIYPQAQAMDAIKVKKLFVLDGQQVS